MATLYEMTATAAMLTALFDNDEIDEQVLNDTLEVMCVEDKLEDYCKVIRQKEANSAAFKAEKLYFAEKQAREEKAIERMKQAITNYMTARGSKEENAGLFNIKLKKSERVIIDDIFNVDENYLRYSEPTADKAAIKKAIKAGETVTGAHLEESRNLSIK